MHEGSEVTRDEQKILSLYPRGSTDPYHINDWIEVGDDLLETHISRVFALIIGIRSKTLVVATCDDKEFIINVIDQSTFLG